MGYSLPATPDDLWGYKLVMNCLKMMQAMLKCPNLNLNLCHNIPTVQ